MRIVKVKLGSRGYEIRIGRDLLGHVGTWLREKVAGDKGFLSSSSETGSTLFTAPFPDYRIPGMGDKTSGVVSGIAGALAMFCIGWGIAALLKKMRAR